MDSTHSGSGTIEEHAADVAAGTHDVRPVDVPLLPVKVESHGPIQVVGQHFHLTAAQGDVPNVVSIGHQEVGHHICREGNDSVLPH